MSSDERFDAAEVYRVRCGEHGEYLDHGYEETLEQWVHPYEYGGSPRAVLSAMIEDGYFDDVDRSRSITVEACEMVPLRSVQHAALYIDRVARSVLLYGAAAILSDWPSGAYPALNAYDRPKPLEFDLSDLAGFFSPGRKDVESLSLFGHTMKSPLIIDPEHAALQDAAERLAVELLRACPTSMRAPQAVATREYTWAEIEELLRYG